MLVLYVIMISKGDCEDRELKKQGWQKNSTQKNSCFFLGLKTEEKNQKNVFF